MRKMGWGHSAGLGCVASDLCSSWPQSSSTVEVDLLEALGAPPLLQQDESDSEGLPRRTRTLAATAGSCEPERATPPDGQDHIRLAYRPTPELSEPEGCGVGLFDERCRPVSALERGSPAPAAPRPHRFGHHAGSGI
jgi:hypothetical protein